METMLEKILRIGGVLISWDVEDDGRLTTKASVVVGNLVYRGRSMAPFEGVSVEDEAKNALREALTSAQRGCPSAY